MVDEMPTKYLTISWLYKMGGYFVDMQYVM